MKTKYHFVTKINGTDQTGIVDVTEHKIICLCDEENGKLILNALNHPITEQGGKTPEEIFSDIITPVVPPCLYYNSFEKNEVFVNAIYAAMREYANQFRSQTNE